MGISRQALSQSAVRAVQREQDIVRLMQQAEELRREHPGCGLEKMYYTLRPVFTGRDRCIALLKELGFGLHKPAPYRRTTYSVASKYSNLIKGMVVSQPGVVWQSDITYYETEGRFYYAVFIMDVYTKMIVGYQVSDHLQASANVRAMQMALAGHKPPRIHHSDRGSQYIYGEYIRLLREHKCKISMASSSQDNAYAERINRTIKEEYLDHWKPAGFAELKACTKKAVAHYNGKRLHNHLNRMTPLAFQQQWKTLKKKQRTTITIFNNHSM